MKPERSPFQMALDRIENPSHREELARWAAEHRVPPGDPMWGALGLTILSEGWSRQNVEALRQAAEAIHAEIEAATEQALLTVAGQARAAGEESRQAIHDTLTRLVTRVAANIDRETTEAVHRAESGGAWGWAAAVFTGLFAGTLFAVLILAGPEWVDRLRGFEPGHSQACQLGTDLIAKWDHLDPSRQQAVAGHLGWTLVPKPMPTPPGLPMQSDASAHTSVIKP